MYISTLFEENLARGLGEEVKNVIVDRRRMLTSMLDILNRNTFLHVVMLLVRRMCFAINAFIASFPFFQYNILNLRSL